MSCGRRLARNHLHPAINPATFVATALAGPSVHITNAITAVPACRVWCPVGGAQTVVMLLQPPGVYRTEGDTQMLTDVMRRGGFVPGRDVLDLGTGCGALAVAAAGAGAASVTAVDLSLRSVLATRLNSRLHGVPVTVRQGDLFAPVAGQRFGLVVANPPYVPAPTAVLPRYRKARCWDAGPDGRAVLDRICAGVGGVLEPGGDVLLVHSAVCDADRTLDALEQAGLCARVIARARVPFGPVMRRRAALLESRGLIRPGQAFEELVVLGARRA